MTTVFRTMLVAAALLTLIGCERPGGPSGSGSGGGASGGGSAASSGKRPNILWVVWDTARADHLSVYGYDKPTTPHLDEWARGATVFEDCITAGTPTPPSHASMFTGLLPIEHGTSHAHEYLDDEHETIAEILSAAGYRTYLFSANAFVSAEQNFTQGFAAAEHPWSDGYKDEAFRIVTAKLDPQDKSSELTERLKAGNLQKQNIKAAGELAIGGVKKWLAGGDAKKPWMVFINWMEAHRQLIPPRRFREKMMTPEQVRASYGVDRSWIPMWMYTFGLSEYTPEQIELTRATYDAALLELDEMFHRLLIELKAAGQLDDTIIILTSDHGEHLGEQHMMDHQYTVYEPVARIPLIVHYPARFAAGRDRRPAVNFDLFPTLLELTGTKSAQKIKHAVSLLASPDMQRPRLCGYPAAFGSPLSEVKRAYERPGSGNKFDYKPWNQPLRAFYDGDYKLIWRPDGRTELFKLGPRMATGDSHLPPPDRGERNDLSKSEPDALARITAAMEAFLKTTKTYKPPRPPPKRSAAGNELLGSIGYGGESAAGQDEEDDDARDGSTSRPSSRPASAPATRPASGAARP